MTILKASGRLVKLFTLIILFQSATLNMINAQDEDESAASINIGADLVSRYVWRGIELGGTPAVPQIQPYGSLDINFSSAGQLSLGVWGSYSLSENFNENDFSLSYTVPTSHGDFTLALTDYYFPYLGIPFSNFESEGNGAHTVEISFAYSGPENFPVNFLVSNNIHNDFIDDNSLYLEGGYSFELNGTSVDLFAGAAKGESIWHAVTTKNFELVNVGFTASKQIKVSNDFSLPIALSFIYNAHVKNTFIVFKLTL